MTIKILAAILAVATFGGILGCSTVPYYWQKESWAKQDVDDAHMTCVARAKVETGTQQSYLDETANNSWGEFMKSCMNGSGYRLVHGYDPKNSEQKADQKPDGTPSRATSSIEPSAIQSAAPAQ